MVMRMAAAMPQWDRRSITGTFGGRLAILYAALQGVTAVLCVKVPSHLASVPNGAVDSLVPKPVWKCGIPHGIPDVVHWFDRPVWPVHWVGLHRRLKGVAPGSGANFLV